LDPISHLHTDVLARLVDVQPLGVLRRHTDIGEDNHLVGTAVGHPQESTKPAVESLLDVRDVVHPAAVLQTQLPHSRVEAQSKGAQQNGKGIGHEQQRCHQDLVQVRPLLAIIVEHVVPGERANVEGVHRRDDGDERQAKQRDEQNVEAGATAAGAAQVAALLGIAGHCMGIQLLQLLAADVDLEVHGLALLAATLDGARHGQVVAALFASLISPLQTLVIVVQDTRLPRLEVLVVGYLRRGALIATLTGQIGRADVDPLLGGRPVAQAVL